MSATPFFTVVDTPPPNATAPSHSRREPAQQAERTEMAPDATEVPHELAASLAPGERECRGRTG